MWVHYDLKSGIEKQMQLHKIFRKFILEWSVADEPCLQEFYGTVDWAVRSIFTGLAGWFDGNPTNLFPLPPREYAEKFVSLVGGITVLKQKIHESYDRGEFQWVLHLVDIVQALEQSSDIDELKWKALEELGERQLNATSRNYFLTASQKTREKEKDTL